MAALVGSLAFGTLACTQDGGTDAGAAHEETQESGTDGARSYATTIEVDADDDCTPTVNGMDDGLCSWTLGGTDASAVAGDDYALTPVVYVADGAYDSEKSVAGNLATIGDERLEDTAITIHKEAVNGIIVNDSDYELEGVEVVVDVPEADGSRTCDFSGLGAALAAYGTSNVTVRDSRLCASGVADLAVFCDSGAKVLLDDVELSSSGGTLYEGYVNSPSQPTMAAPPWILGIMGTSRGTNLMGTQSTMTVIDSSAEAANWAVLSTDAGSDMRLNVVNTTMRLTGSDKPFQQGDVFDVENPYTDRSGYGTYAIGDAQETFLGVTMQVGTYATIFTGGSGYYGNLERGASYELLAADGTTQVTYTAEQDVTTTIESDTFGFMAHQNANVIDIDGATVHSTYSGILVKSGCDCDVTVRGGADVKADNGILLQLMDNDDSTTSYDSEANAFAVVHEEYAGFPTEAVSVSDGGGAKTPDMDAEGVRTTEGEGAPGTGEGNQPPAAPDDADRPSAPPESRPDGEGPGDEPPADVPGDAGQTAPQKPDGDKDRPGDAGGKGGPHDDADGAHAGKPSSGKEDGQGALTTNHATYTIEDTSLEGALYNGIGWRANDFSEGNVVPMTLTVTLKGTAELTGPIASTSCIHTSFEGIRKLASEGVTAFDDADEAATFAKDYQLTSFTKAEYFNIGQVANLVSSNGLNDIDVTLCDKAIWHVSDTSLITGLTVTDEAKVVVEGGVTLTVSDVSYGAGTYTAEDFA